MYRSRTVLHVRLNESTQLKQIIPITVYITPEGNLEWFNTTAPDPTYFNQIIQALQDQEWQHISSARQSVDAQCTKKSDSKQREIVLPAIKFIYEVRPNSRTYNVLQSRPETRFAPIPMASFELIVWCYPIHATIPSQQDDDQPRVTEYFKPDS